MNLYWTNILILIYFGSTCLCFPGRVTNPILFADGAKPVHRILNPITIVNQRESEQHDSHGIKEFNTMARDQRERDSKVFRVPSDVTSRMSPDRQEISRDFLLETLKEIFKGNDKNKKNPSKRSTSNTNWEDFVWGNRNTDEEGEDNVEFSTDSMNHDSKPLLLSHKRRFTNTKTIPVSTHNSATDYQRALDLKAARSKIYGRQLNSKPQEFKKEDTRSKSITAELSTVEKNIGRELKDVESFVDLPHLLETTNLGESNSVMLFDERKLPKDDIGSPSDEIIIDRHALPTNLPLNVLDSREQFESDPSVHFFMDSNNKVSAGKDLSDDQNALEVHDIHPLKTDKSNDQQKQMENFDIVSNNQKAKRNNVYKINDHINSETKIEDETKKYKQSSDVGASHRKSEAQLIHDISLVDHFEGRQIEDGHDNLEYFFEENDKKFNEEKTHEKSNDYDTNNNRDISPSTNYLKNRKPQMKEDHFTVINTPENLSSSQDLQYDNFNHWSEQETTYGHPKKERNAIYIRISDENQSRHKFTDGNEGYTNSHVNIGDKNQYRPSIPNQDDLYDSLDQIQYHKTPQLINENSEKERNTIRHQLNQERHHPITNFEHQSGHQNVIDYDEINQNRPHNRPGEQTNIRTNHQTEHQIPEDQTYVRNNHQTEHRITDEQTYIRNNHQTEHRIPEHQTYIRDNHQTEHRIPEEQTYITDDLQTEHQIPEEQTYIRDNHQTGHRIPEEQTYITDDLQTEHQIPEEQTYITDDLQTEHQIPEEQTYIRDNHQTGQWIPEEQTYIRGNHQTEHRIPEEQTYIRDDHQIEHRIPEEQTYIRHNHQTEHRVPEEQTYIKHNHEIQHRIPEIVHDSPEHGRPIDDSNIEYFESYNHEDEFQYQPQNRQKDTINEADIYSGSRVTGFNTFNMGKHLSKDDFTFRQR